MIDATKNPPGNDPSPKRTYRLMALGAIATIVLLSVAIFSLSKAKNTEPSEPVLAKLSLTPTAPRAMPQFSITDQGKTLSPEQFAGHWTLVTFWAEWCEPCRTEMSELDQLYEQWQAPNFEFLSVNVDTQDGVERAKSYLADGDFSLPTVFDESGGMKKAFNVGDLPHHFLINPDQKIVWEARGAFKWNEPKAREQLEHIMGEAAFKPTEPDEKESTLPPPADSVK